MRKKLRESAIIPKPQYKVTLEGESLIAVFDVNTNETKTGVKLRFHPQNKEIDIRHLNDIANKIAVVLQKKFAQYGIQIDRDTELRDPHVIGFMIPIASVASFIMNRVIKSQNDEV